MLDDHGSSIADALEQKSKNSSGKGKHGGARPGAGRKKGSLTKTTAEIRELAQKYTGDALTALVDILKKGDSETARISAAKEILDRAYGKSTQPLEGGDGPPIDTVNTIRIELVDPNGSGS